MLWYGNWIILHLNVRLLEGGWPNMCVANKCHHLSGLAWQFLVPGHYQNWWLHWLLIIKMSVSQIHDIWMIYFVSQWVGGWEIRFPKSHGSYPDNVCKLQLYGTYMYVIIGCQYLSGLDCHFFFLTLNTPSWKFMNASFALSLLMSWCQTTVHHQQQCFIDPDMHHGTCASHWKMIENTNVLFMFGKMLSREKKMLSPPMSFHAI